MSYYSFGPDNTVLGRRNSLAEDLPGAKRWVQNKGTDQSGHTDTENVDGTGYWEIRAYCPTTIVAYTPSHFTYDGDEETNPKVIAFTDADNNNDRLLVVPQEGVTGGTFGWFAYAGYCKCLVDGGTDVAKDDYLLLDTDGNGGLTALMTSGGAVETNSTVAIACEAQADSGDVAIRVFLLGKEKICDRQ